MRAGQLPLLLRTAWRETVANVRDFRVMILSLFLGVFVIALIFNITGALENGLRRNGKAILGGDIMVRQIYEPLDTTQQALLSDKGDVSTSIEMRGLIYNPNQEQTALTEIKAIDATYPLFGDLVLQENGVVDNLYGFLQTPDGEVPYIVVDQALAERLNVNIGETLRLGTVTFTLKDLIVSEPDRAGGSTFAVGPRSMMTREAIQQSGLIVTGGQVYYKYRLALTAPETLEAVEETLKTELGDQGARVQKYTNASPRIESFLERLRLFFILVGLSALLIGGVGIGNATKVVLEKRLASLAIMKSVGASSAFVFMLWVTILGLTAFLGIIPATGLAQVIPFFVFDWVGHLLPVSAVPIVTVGGIIQPIFLGLAILFIFSILTLSVAAHVKPALLLKSVVTEGLHGQSGRIAWAAFAVLLIGFVAVIIITSNRPLFTSGFIVMAMLTFLVLRLTSWVLVSLLKPLRQSSRAEVRLAVTSLTKTGNQTLTILTSLGLALTLFTTIALIEHNVKNRIADDIPDQAPAFFFIDIQKSQIEQFKDMIGGIEAVSDLNKVPNLRGRITMVNGVEAEQALVDESESWLLRGDRGFTYLTEQPDYSDLIAGEWWPSDYSGEPIISIVEDVATAFDIGVGDQITVNILGRDITATVANVRTVDWSTMTINFAISFAPGILDNAPHSYLATISAPKDIEDDILNRTARNFPNVTAIEVREALEVVSTILRQIGIAMRIIASLALVTGVLVLFSSILSSLRQRRYETILMKVIGTTPKMIGRAIRLEFVILGGTAGALALILGSLASYLVIVFVMDFPWVWHAPIAVSVIAASLCITLVFSFWALSKTLYAKPNDYLRNE